MNLPSFSVKRPIFTTMVTLILVILGAVSLSRLQIDMLPNIELPTLSIRTDYEGASPEVMERLVTQIIEEIVATVPGVEEITSTSSEGRSRVRVSFVWGTEIDTAAIDVQGKLEDEINELPDDIVRPRIRKFDIASFPVVLLGISSNLDPVELTELIEVQIRYRFARIPGVAPRGSDRTGSGPYQGCRSASGSGARYDSRREPRSSSRQDRTGTL
jgi:HAE1 family hydrophobic/amphiphilic exporter-1